MVALLIAVVNTRRLHSLEKMACLRLAMLMATLAVATRGYAAPGKTARHGRDTLALAPAQADGNLSKSALEGIDRVLASHAAAYAEVVSTKVLDKRVKPDFATAVRLCKRDGGCLTRLAKTLHVDTILVPLAKPESRGTSLNVVVAGDTSHKVSLVFVTSADLHVVIESHAVSLFGDDAAPPPAPTVVDSAADSIAVLPLEPLQAPVAEAKNEPKPDSRVEPTPIALTPPSDPMGLEAPPLDDSIVVRREPSRVTWKTYIGATAALIGAAGVTYGIVQYAHHKSLVNDANGDPSLTQREAKDVDDEAQSAYDHSRVALFVGTPLLLAGAALLTWDLFVDDHGSSSAMAEKRLRWSVLPVSGGAAGSMTLTW